MAGGKLSPRQKMINMMYLVLTALLALNVTKEVINAFVTINESVVLTKDNLDKKNQNIYAAFAQAMSVDATKYADANRRAELIRKEANSINKYLEETKEILIRKCDKLEPTDSLPKLPEMENKEDYDTPTRIMIGDNDHSGKGAKADTLKQLLDKFKKTIVENAPAQDQADFKKRMETLLNTNDPPSPVDGKSTWELVSFYHNPVVATVALLSKFESDIRTAESQVTEDLFNSIGKIDFRPDRLTPAVIPNATVVTNGSNYEAKVFLAATSSTLAPDVFKNATFDSTTNVCKGCDEANKIKQEGGYAIYTDPSTGEGERKWGGVIRVTKGDGSMQYFPFSASYTAQKPSSVVSADQMNVFYIGVDNPVSISVPGVSSDQVFPNPSGSGLTLRPDPTKGKGHYIATVTTPGKATIDVSATTSENKKTPMGKFEFRVKTVPNPVATISNKFREGKIDKNILKAGVLIPIMDNFDFNLFFETVSFTMTIMTPTNLISENQNGPTLSEKMKDYISKAKPGTKVYFENIKARMKSNTPGANRSLSPMTFTIL